MPVVNLQDQSVATLRKKYIALVKSASVPQQAKSQAIAKANTMTKAQLVSELGGAMKQQVKQQVKAQVKSQKAKSQKAKARGTRKSAKGGRKTKGGAARLIKIPKLLRSRVGKIMRAIKAGTVAVKQGKDTPSKYALSDARDRYTAFANLYKDERITRKSRKSKKTRKSIKAVFAQVQGQKFPYMLKKGYRVPARVVGGGARGAGIIRAVPGEGAAAFSTLSDAEQAKVVAFLNANGKKLRGKGAGTKTVNLQAIKRQATAQTQRRKSQKAARKSRKSMQGAANRR